MAEYIDREKLTKHIEDEIEAFGNPSESQKPLAYGGVLALRYCKSVAVTLPTADVVEVVRCKDCKYYDNEQCYHRRHDHHGQSVYQEEDDFCSYGEKMDGKGEKDG